MSKLVTVLCAVIFVSAPTQGQDPVNEVHNIYHASLCYIGKAENLVTRAQHFLDQATAQSNKQRVELEETKEYISNYVKNYGLQNHNDCQYLEAEMSNFEAKALGSINAQNLEASQLENTITNKAKPFLENVKKPFCRIKNQKSNAESCTKQGEKNCYVNPNALANQEWEGTPQSFESLMNQTQLLINKVNTAREDTGDDSFRKIIERWDVAYYKCYNAMHGDNLPFNSYYDEP